MPTMCSVAAGNGPIVLRGFALALAAASLAACAQSSVVSRKSEFRQAAVERHQYTRVATTEHRVSIVRRHDPYASEKHTGDLKLASHGVASFYHEEQLTANGEKFNPNELTAAHPSLPFGTKLRVTNTANGQSVTVRVNDRGPVVEGRIIDLSYQAACVLHLEHQGIQEVRLDLVSEPQTEAMLRPVARLQ